MAETLANHQESMIEKQNVKHQVIQSDLLIP